MADGLLGMLGGGQQQAQQGNMLGGLFQSESQARRQGRNRLLGQALQIAQQQDPVRSGFALAGGLLGQGIARSMGRVTPEEARQQKFAGLQQQLMSEGLDPTQDPAGFYNRTSELLYEMGETGPALQAAAKAREFATEPQRSTLRIVGGTDRANAIAQRFPEIGELQEGEEVILEVEGGRIVDITTRRPRKEDDDTPPIIREYTEAINRGLIDPEQVSYTEYVATSAGGDPRETVTPTDTRIKPFLDTIEGTSELDDQISAIAPGKDPAQFAGINIPFTGSKDIGTTRREVAIRAAEIREQNPELTFNDAVQSAIDELSQQVGISVPTSEESSTEGSDRFSNVTE